MIASLTGILKEKGSSELIVDVGGVGYRVFVSLQTFHHLPNVGDRVTLMIHTAVRENDLSLYGFLESEEKTLFQKLISVSGIGPRLAMTVLSGIASQDLIQALRAEDLVRLTAISGIGKKTAERMIVELKDKLMELTATPIKRPLHEDLLSALLNLGYNRPIAERTLSQMKIGENISLEHLVREALKILAENRV